MSAHHPKNDPALVDLQTGRLDAVRIAQDMGLPIDTVAKAIGLNTPVVCQQPDSSALYAKLWPLLPDRLPDCSTVRLWSSGLDSIQLALSFLRQTVTVEVT